MATAAPATRFVEHDGINIAYQVVGEGPPDLLFVPGWISNLDMFWTADAPAAFLGRIGSFCRLIPFDKPGTGLSDPIGEVPTLEERIDQVMTILDAAGAERVAVMGLSEGGITAALLAAARPDRVTALILLNTLPGLDPRMQEAVGPEVIEGVQRMGEETVAHWGEGHDAARWLASLEHRPPGELAQLWGRIQRACATRATARRYLEVSRELSAWDVLPAIRQPTLVAHRRGDRVLPFALATAMAQRIPGARLVELPGEDHLPWLGDSDSVVEAIRTFLGVAEPDDDDNRVLATLLFTDLVASTDRLAEVGDARWRSLLERHDQIAQRTVERQRGRIVKTTGDGILAVFDGPARAVRCAQRLLGELGEEGLDARAGLHTGEVEMRGEDVAGLAVHVAARVMGTAGPGEVVASRTVRDLVAGSGLAFEERGAHQLKGVPGAWELFAVR